MYGGEIAELIDESSLEEQPILKEEVADASNIQRKKETAVLNTITVVKLEVMPELGVKSSPDLLNGLHDNSKNKTGFKCAPQR